MKNIFIGSSWPYANNSLHISNIATLLPGDILARYFRMKGENVLYISGSDCHGTPISVRAEMEETKPEKIAEQYHREFERCFRKLGFSFDLYTKTHNPFHEETASRLFKKLLDNGFLYTRKDHQYYCPQCKRFLPDRYIEGICPSCKNPEARGDQCENCGSILEPDQLTEHRCNLCGCTPEVNETEQFYFRLSAFQEGLEHFIENKVKLSDNALKITRKYFEDGLKDRAVTRDLEWGVKVPVKGFEGKSIYVWIEALLGYYSASIEWGLKKQDSNAWREFWEKQKYTVENTAESSDSETIKIEEYKTVSYYVHGKNNVPFHTIIFPALLMGIGDLKLPDIMISSENINIEGKRLSLEDNWVVWGKDMLERYHPDAIRYYLIKNRPETKDVNFTWTEFYKNNNELAGDYGNFVNRVLSFIVRYFDSSVPERINESAADSDILHKIEALYDSTGKLIEKGEFRKALIEIYDFIKEANRYFDIKQPWSTIKSNIEDCRNTLNICTNIILNLSNLCAPFMPFTSEKIKSFMNCSEQKWEYREVNSNSRIHDVSILFERLNLTDTKYELRKLGSVDQPSNWRRYFTFAYNKDFELESGRKFGPITVAYEVYGQANENRDNIICVCHALTGDSHMARHNEEDSKGWWEGFVGDGLMFDTSKYCFICSNILSGCQGTTGPSSINPVTGRPYGARFPIVTIGDMVKVQKALMDHLGIQHLYAVIGSSMGGMQALEWVLRYPDFMDKALVVSCPMSLEPQAIGFHEIMRRAIINDPNWNNGDYYSKNRPRDGLSIARMLGMITYQSPSSMNRKFGRQKIRNVSLYEGFDTLFEVGKYLNYQGEKFNERFDPNTYMYITKAMDLYDVCREWEQLEDVMKRVSAKMMVVGITSDILFPTYQQKEMVAKLKASGVEVIYREIDSPNGHDAFLIEKDQMQAITDEFFAI